MSRIYSKFCGITRINDAQAAVAAGCDAIGLVRVQKSPRYVDLNQALAIANSVRDQVDIVLLFADNDATFVEQSAEQIQPDILQFHGKESADFCNHWGIPFWKAIPMRDSHNIDQYLQQYTDASMWLLDNYGENHMGGSGSQFEWFEFPQKYKNKLMLAGGLTVDNVTSAIKQTGTRYVDVSSGIESNPGIKSHKKMQLFIKNLKSYDN